ncbi:MAG: general secretion pathway protein E [Verrucomicrobiales bacterium]
MAKTNPPIALQLFDGQLLAGIISDGDNEIDDANQLACRRLVAEAHKLNASDIHIDPLLDGFVVRLRIDGVLKELGRLDRETGIRFINQLKVEVGISPGPIFLPKGSRHKYVFDSHELDMRITLVPCISGEKVAVRMLEPDRVEHRIEDLGVSSEGLRHFRDWLGGLNGMFLVSGATSSGKTTTLYALLHELAERDQHVLTIEDPVEYEIDGINQIQVDPIHGLDFATGLKSMLRLDPDYMMVGELRDAEAAAVAARAATSGQVLLSTVHARDAVSTITALRNFGMSGNQIAVTVAVIVNQRLVRKLCSHCRVKEAIPDDERDWLVERGVSPQSGVWTASGCKHCLNIGYSGRTGIFEIWRLNTADYDMLLAGADERNLRRKLAQSHHQSLVLDAWKKVQSGVTSIAEIRNATGALRADDWIIPG